MPIPWIAILAIGVLATATPPTVDTIAGDNIQPDNILYPIEKTGEAMKTTLTLGNHSQLAIERTLEYQAMQNKNKTMPELLNESNYHIQQEKNQTRAQQTLQHRNKILTRVREQVGSTQARDTITRIINQDLKQIQTRRARIPQR